MTALTRSKVRRTSVFFLSLSALGAMSGCENGEPWGVAGPESTLDDLQIELQISGVRGVDSPMAVAVNAIHESGEPLAGIQGYLRFDPSELQYLGQPLEGEDLVLVNAKRAAEGELRILSENIHGLPSRAAVLAFRPLCGSCDGNLSYRLEVAETRSAVPIWSADISGKTIEVSDLTAPENPRVLGIDDWAARLAPDLIDEATPTLERVPGMYRENLLFGDAIPDGVVNVLDSYLIANVSVGNIELIVDSDYSPAHDAVVTGNVLPFNLPGLGELGDDLEPGVEANGTRVINVLDITAIKRESVGFDQNVVGEVIPGRAPITTNRVILSGDITEDRTLYSDTIYELQGTVQVYNYATLTIQPGTRIEGDRDTFGALVIHRGADIVAEGTYLLPIVFTCDISHPDRGCWGGVTINGFGPLNNTEVIGSFELTREGTGTYGGNLVEDSSGVLRYVRIERTGRYFSFGRMPGLSLMGVGSGTVIDRVQVHRGSGDGVFVSGGKVDMTNIVLTDNGDVANGGSGLRWDDGWGAYSFDSTTPTPGGRVQFLIVRQDAGGQNAIRGSSSPESEDGPSRSIPQVYNATIVGYPGSLDTTVVFERATGGVLRNSIVLGSGGTGAGVDVDGTDACLMLGNADGIRIENSIFFGNSPDFTTGPADCDVGAYALDPAQMNRVLDPAITSPFGAWAADFRLLADSPALLDAVSPPADGFFDTTALFIGAVPARSLTGSSIPWFSGWTRWGGEYY